MANGIRTGDPSGFNKGRSSKFHEGSRVRQTPEEGRRTYRPNRCRNNNKDEDNSLKNLNDKNQQASSQKFRQLGNYWYLFIRVASVDEIKKDSQWMIIMTLIQTICPICITLNVGKQGPRSAEFRSLAPVFENSATEPKLKPKPKLLRCRSIVHIATCNVDL